MPPLTVAIVIPSLGRAAVLRETLADLRAQSQPPDRVLIAVTVAHDVPPDIDRDRNVDWFLAPKGSCRQRNAALDRLGGACDIVAFWDDDYVPSRFAVERLAAFFAAFPDVAGTSGRVLADGVNGPAIDIAAARALLTAYDSAPPPPAAIHRELRDGLYGCNMAFRSAALTGLRFDERLPLYGWQEDIDLSGQVLRRGGRIVRTWSFAGVHRGVKSGRSSGARLGYSQIVNPVYLARKGTMRPRYAARLVLRAMLANHLRMARPEAWVDRAGRARGNRLALLDLLRGRITPERIEQL